MSAVMLEPVPRSTAGQRSRWFYVGFAGVCVLIAFGGFTPTYWAPLAAGKLVAAPIAHIHGALFFTWTLFFFAQTMLVALGRSPDHRAWGLAGISLATAMACSAVLAALHSVRGAASLGMDEQALRFSFVPLSAAVLFAGFVVAAIVAVKHSEAHKRLMLMAMIPLMQAAMARVFMTFLAPPGAAGPPPVAVTVPPGLMVDLLLVAALAHDWRTRGRPHAAYLFGVPLLLAHQVLAVPMSASSTWMSIARWVQSLAG